MVESRRDSAHRIAKRFRRLSDRFRAIDHADDEVANRAVRAAGADAGKVLKDAADNGHLGFSAGIELPREFDRDSALDLGEFHWGLLWHGVVNLLARDDTVPVTNPNALRTKQNDAAWIPEPVALGNRTLPDWPIRLDARDWRIRAERYAVICDWLADRLDAESVQHCGLNSDDPKFPIGDSQSPTEPPRAEVAELTNTLSATADLGLIFLGMWARASGKTGNPRRAGIREASDGKDKKPLSPCYEKAYRAFKLAEQKLERGLTAAEAHEWLTEQGHSDYDLPAKATFECYLRRARKHYGEQRNSPRAGRSGRSIVSARELHDGNRGDDE